MSFRLDMCKSNAGQYLACLGMVEVVLCSVAVNRAPDSMVVYLSASAKLRLAMCCERFATVLQCVVMTIPRFVLSGPFDFVIDWFRTNEEFVHGARTSRTSCRCSMRVGSWLMLS